MSPKQNKPKQKTFHNLASMYASRFGKNDDQTRITDEERQIRQQTAAEGSKQYYDFATSAYLSGWGTHFHYTPFAPTDTISSAQHFYEHRLALLMGLKPGMKVLDVGCGVGGPAREIAKFIGCEIVGISINQSQLDIAIELTAQAGLGHLCTFVRGDFMKLEEWFGRESFDAAYAIEATCHAPSCKEVYAGIAKVLKPGGVFGVSEWVMTPGFDASDSKHIGIRNRIERGNGVANLQTSDECRGAMVHAGFKVFHEEDYARHWDHLSRSDQPLSPPFSTVTIPTPTSTSASFIYAAPPSRRMDPAPPTLRPWYWPLEGRYHLATTWEDWWIAFRMAKTPRFLCYWVVWLLELLRIYPKVVVEAMTTMGYCVDSVRDGGREGCFSPFWWFVGRKEETEAENEQ